MSSGTNKQRLTQNNTKIQQLTQTLNNKVIENTGFPIEVSTSSAMDALLVSANVGKVYKFTGTTDANYTNGDLYIVESFNSGYVFKKFIQTYNIANILSNCSTNNASTYIQSGQAYSATLSAATGYTLTGGTVSVTMNGTDITSTVYNNGVISIASVTGNIVISVTAVVIVYSITNSLSNCTSNNAATTIQYGSSYSATITANTDYTLTGASVSITMGGTDITSTAYNSGTISIASVTGDLAITITAVSDQPVPVGSPIYGVEWVNDDTTTMTRTDNAVGMTYAINSSTGEVASDFDNVFPWNEAQIVTDNAGNKFLRMPDMYFRIGNDENDDINSVAVSKSAGEEGTWHLCESFDWGIYGGSLDVDTLKSVSGQSRTENTSITDFRTYATNNTESGYTYHLTDLKHKTVMMFLWWIEFATKDSNSIMTGHYYADGGTYEGLSCPTGTTDNLTTPTGFNTSTFQMRYHYIEDFVGNFGDFVDGFQMRRNGYAYVTDDPQYFGDEYDNGVLLDWRLRVDSNRTLGAYAYDPNVSPFLIAPSKIYLVEGEAFCARLPANSSSSFSTGRWSAIGGPYYDGGSLLNDNLSRIIYYTSTGSETAIGARLMRIPTSGGVL